MEIIKRYIIGEGVTAVGSGHRTLKPTGELLGGFITFSDIEKTDVGRDILGQGLEELNITRLEIKNLEGLAVVEKAIQTVRKILEENGMDKM